MLYILCPRCQFKVNVKKQACPTCGFNIHEYVSNNSKKTSNKENTANNLWSKLFKKIVSNPPENNSDEEKHALS